MGHKQQQQQQQQQISLKLADEKEISLLYKPQSQARILIIRDWPIALPRAKCCATVSPIRTTAILEFPLPLQSQHC